MMQLQDLDECRCSICRAGRVLQENGRDIDEGLYVVGWAKRGPTGIIGETSQIQIEMLHLHLVFVGDLATRPSTAEPCMLAIRA